MAGFCTHSWPIESRKETPVYDAPMRYVIGLIALAAFVAWAWTYEEETEPEPVRPRFGRLAT